MAGWFKGTVKGVPSGDSLLIMAQSKDGIPPEKSITLSSLMAPRLARRDTHDDPFAWQSREFLRNKCIGKEVTFKVDYTVPNLNNREFGSVFMDSNTTNVALLVAGSGWAKVRQGTEKSPYFEDLLKAEERAKEQGLGIWNKEPGAADASIRSIPPSAIGDGGAFDAREFLRSTDGAVPAIVEQVRDGSSFRVYLLPSFQFVQVHLAGVQSPLMARRAAQSPPEAAENEEAKEAKEAGNGTAAAAAPLTTAQRVAASTNSEGPDPWAREAKHFTEARVLHREVRIELVGTDKFNTLFGVVYFTEKNESVNLGLELVKQGLAKYAEWSANMLEEEQKRQLKAAELQSKRAKLRMFTGFEIPPSTSKAIKNDSFTGKVIEVFSADCLIVLDDTAGVERRVNLSSIQAPKRGTTPTDDTRYRDAKEFIRTRVIGQQVQVFMEYSRTIQVTNNSGAKENRVLDFGSVFLQGPAPKGLVFEPPVPGQPEGYNVAEMVVGNGYAQVVRHRDFDDRSSYYDTLLAAEKKALSGKKGLHSPQRGAAVHVNDLTVIVGKNQASNKARQFLPFLQRARKLSAVVDHVFSGHRFKLYVPKETCLIFLSLSGVRSPGKDEPFGADALAFMRRRVLHRDVEIEVENVDRNGSFLGSLYDGKTNVGVALLEAGLAKLQHGFADRITDGHLLLQAEEHAKKQRLKIWEKEEVETESSRDTSKQEVLQVQVTEVLGGGQFYVQIAGDTRVSSIQQQLESLSLAEKQAPAPFKPGNGEQVLAHYSGDDSWYRASVVKSIGKDEYEVFYMDYGNQEVLPLSRLRPYDPSVSGAPGLAQLCSLAYIKVPSLEEDFGDDAAEFLSQAVANKKLMAKVYERDTVASGGKAAKGQGFGSRLIVTLVDGDSSKSINAAVVEAGLARLEKAGRWDSKEKKAALESLGEYQETARKAREYMWQYGDVESDDEDMPGGGRGRGAGRK